MGFLDNFNGFLKDCNEFFDERNGSKKHHEHKAHRKTEDSEEAIQESQTELEEEAILEEEARLEEEEEQAEHDIALLRVVDVYIDHHRR